MPTLHLKAFADSRPLARSSTLACVLTVAVAFSTERVAAQTACATPANAIVAENCLPGNPQSEWGIVGAGAPEIQGFATDMSVNKGQTISFKVKTPAVSYRIDIYRIGYYNGNGARKVATMSPSVTLPQSQPNCLTDVSTGLVDCGNWAVSAAWAVPADATSGLYIGRLVRQDGTSGESHITFVVRDDNSSSHLLYQTSDTTWQAYNDFGGNSLYTGSPAGRAYKVSYNRPFVTYANSYGQHTWWLVNEYPMIRWLERNGYNLSYTTGVDSDRHGNEILEHKVFLSVGHDEYWSGGQRTYVENARDAGVHLAFFSGDAVFWKTRWESSISSPSTPYRTLVCYKETHANARIDPFPEWTGTWRDPRFSPPADGGRPENQLMGTIFKVNCCEGRAIDVSSAQGKLRFWRNTSFASLAAGQTGTTANGVIGFESDEAPDDPFTPPGLVRLSTTTRSVSSYLQDYGTTYAPGTATHSLTLHRRTSGALVFGAGTVRWSWGLEGGDHGDGTSVEDVNMQQATVNLFADMGVQPGSLQSNLAVAAASTDTTAPATTITSPTGGTSVSGNVSITGTASDVGGLVAHVEVSVDGGATWRSATGTTTWTYSWVTSTVGAVTLKSRAVDDSGNVEIPSAGVTVNVTPRVCPCTIWSDSTVPAIPASTDATAVEVGAKFRVTKNGSVTGIRFYKGTGNTGTHVGKLWSATGTLLGSATFSSETATGWQQVAFASPIPVVPDTTYVASYFAPVGRYAFDSNYFASAVDSPPLRALANGEDGGNGVYLYTTSGGFPINTFNATNYWVDVVFNDGSVSGPPAAVNDAYTTNQGQVLTVAAPGVLGNDTSPGGSPLTAIKAANPANGAVTLNANGSFTYTPNAGFGGSDSFTYKANNGTADSNIATVNIKVNRPPVAGNDAYTAVQGQVLTIAAPGVLSNDTDPDGNPLTSVKVTNPVNGTVTLATNGGFSYTPNAGFAGSDTFTYSAGDGSLNSDVATVTITVTAGPTALNDVYATNQGQVLSVATPGVLGNDTSPGGTPVTAIKVTNPVNGAVNLNANGSFTYTPNAGFGGSDSFTYKANNGTSDSNIATVTIKVNRPPVAGNDAYTAKQGQSLAVPAPALLSNDTDPDGDPLTAIKVTNPAHGTVAIAVRGGFIYTPNAGFAGSDTFTYKARDGSLDSNVATVTITVTALPTASNDAYTTNQGQILTVAAPGVLGNDTSPGGSSLTAIKVTNPASGTVTLNSNGSFTYTPNAGFGGSDSFTYKANNGTSDSNIATVNIKVNRPPVATNNTYTVAQGHVLTIAAPGVLSNDSDPDGDPLTAIKVTNPANGTVTLAANGGFSYTPNAAFAGADIFTYKARDGSLDSNTAAVTITVTGVPTAVNDAYATNQGQVLTVAAPGVLGNDASPGGSPLTATKVTNPANGTVALNANGSFTYTPNAGFGGADSFTYKANNGTSDSNVATVTIMVNRAPVAGNDSYTTRRRATLTIAAPGVLGNDSDPGGNSLAAIKVTNPAHGTVSLSANGAFVYNPKGHFNGTDVFTYKANNGALDSNIATVTITVLRH